MRLDGYLRVSQVRGRAGESFMSPDVQRQQVQAWAKMRGARIVAWHTDLDVPGSQKSRQGLDVAIRRVQQGQSDGIVVAKLDRFARNLTNALETIQIVDKAGGSVISVAEGIDPSTAAGKMLTRLLLVFAEWELDRIRETWRTARERAVARGVHIASKTPTGYVRGDGRVLRPGPFAPAIREVFARRAAGASWPDLARLLEQRQVVGPYNSPRWPPRAVAHIIANPVYLGQARSGEFVNRSAHQAIVDRGTWEAAQTARGSVSRGEASLLAGLLRCAGCRHLMKPDRQTLRSGERARTYRCRGRHASGECEARAFVLGRVIEPWAVEQLLALQTRARGESAPVETAELERVLLAAEDELAAFRDDERIVGVLGPDRFVEGLKVRVEAVEKAQADLATRPSEMILDADLESRWPRLPTLKQRALLALAIDTIMLRRAGNIPIADRALIFWRGEEPAGLPKRGHRVPFASFDWPEA